MRSTGFVLAAVLVCCACDGSSRTSASPPRLAPAACGTYDGQGCAPARERVDLHRPTFANPTRITNPLFPISRLHSALLLGHVDGKPFRTETTLLPHTETITWNGQRIQALVSQYVAYLGGRLQEVALDRYAQADDGSVWYLGEDVFDYANGTVAATEGTWLAGREGPAAMIMPAHPKVGDVYRTENVPGVVFEEVTVRAVDKTVAGPRGPVTGAIVGAELHADGTHEDKIFAPGYGEFRTAGGGDLEALALAVPTDAAGGSMPAELATLATGAVGVLESSRIGERDAASATLRGMTAAWKVVRAGGAPPMVAARMSAALERLTGAVRARRPHRTEQAAVDVAQSALDLQLRYRPVVEVDQARFVLWTQQLRIDAAARNGGAVTGDVATLEWIRDRIAQSLRPSARREIDARLRALRAATDARNLPAAADHAARLAARLRDLT